jgi:hypothetical protein
LTAGKYYDKYCPGIPLTIKPSFYDPHNHLHADSTFQKDEFSKGRKIDYRLSKNGQPATAVPARANRFPSSFELKNK